jgi:ABC-type uncharacterized transport system permease subunit
MILLHIAVIAAYALAAWSLWPAAQPAIAATSPATTPAANWRFSARAASWLMPLVLGLHAVLAVRSIATPTGFDVSLGNAMSVVAGLVAALAWMSGLLRTMPAIGTIVLPVAAAGSLLPALMHNVHRFAYADQPWAAIHVAVALAAYALLIVAAVQALLMMGFEKRLHRRLPDPRVDAMPPLLTLEHFLFRLVAAGFILLTVTLATGIGFSEQIFGKPVVFSHKSVFSVLGWLTFGGLLWGRWRYGWRGRVALRWILAGTVFVLLAYLGTKFVIEVLLGR